MADPNISELATTTLEYRSPKIRDNFTNSNALLKRMSQKGNIRPCPGGRLIYEPLMYVENGNGGWFSGFDTLPVAAQSTITSPEFNWKQYICAVTMSGLEKIQNSGEAAVFDLLAQRIKGAEGTISNALNVGLYSDGTTFSGKTITGLDAAVPVDPTTGTYGGINRATATNTFWRSQLYDPATTSATNVQAQFNYLWALCNRGNDRPDLIIAGSSIWQFFMASVQTLQRFTGADVGDLGFPSVKFMGADVVLENATITATDAFFLNTNYLHWRPHTDTNMVPIGKQRVALNQDAFVEMIGFAGNLTCSGAKFQGRLKGD